MARVQLVPTMLSTPRKPWNGVCFGGSTTRMLIRLCTALDDLRAASLGVTKISRLAIMGTSRLARPNKVNCTPTADRQAGRRTKAC